MHPRTRTKLALLLVVVTLLAARPVRRFVGERMAIAGLRLAGSATPPMSRAVRRRQRLELEQAARRLRVQREHPDQPV